MYKKLLVILMLCFTAVIYGNDRKIIKAYEKGKPAEMKIEVTKVKSDNYLDLIIDRLNKKFYKDITGKNTDLKRNLYITDTLERINSVADLRNEYPYKVVEYNGKKYLEVDYLGKPEPENIYFWVTKGNKIKKLYTGEVVDEYLDLTRAEAHVILKEEQSEKGKFDKISEESIIIKIGEIEHRKESQEAIRLSVAQNRYVLKGEETKGIIPVELYFDKDGTKEILLDKNNRRTTLYGKIDVNTKDDYNLEKYNLVDDKNSNGSFSIKADFTSKLLSRSAVNSGYVNTVYKLNPKAMVKEGGYIGEIKFVEGWAGNYTAELTFKKFGWFASLEAEAVSCVITLTDKHFPLDFIEKFSVTQHVSGENRDKIGVTRDVIRGELVLSIDDLFDFTHKWDALGAPKVEHVINYEGYTLKIYSGDQSHRLEGRVTEHMRFMNVKEGEAPPAAKAEFVFITDNNYTNAKFELFQGNENIDNTGIVVLKKRLADSSQTESTINVQLQKLKDNIGESNAPNTWSGNDFVGGTGRVGRYQMIGKISADQTKGKIGEYTGTLTLRITLKN